MKVDVKELRIGNYLQNPKNGEVFQVCREDFKFEKGLANLEDYEPVELTEEWFKKFGFNQMGMWKIIKDIEFSQIKGYGLALKGLDGYNRLNQNSIKYVHQLQNLFYAICGEELTIKN